MSTLELYYLFNQISGAIQQGDPVIVFLIYPHLTDPERPKSVITIFPFLLINILLHFRLR